jgi:hypothetical protein
LRAVEILAGATDGRRALGMSAGELVANRAQLPLLERPDGDPAPALGGADHRRVHQLEHRPLTEGVGDDLGAPALFEEEPLEEIRCRSGALLCRLRSRWTRQRWRSARGKQVSTARIRPGARSVTARSGSGSPRRLRSSKKAVQLAVSSFVPGARITRTIAPWCG